MGGPTLYSIVAVDRGVHSIATLETAAEALIALAAIADITTGNVDLLLYVEGEISVVCVVRITDGRTSKGERCRQWRVGFGV